MKRSPIVFGLFGYDSLARQFCEKHNYKIGKFSQHQFPDNETLIKIDDEVSGHEIILMASLDNPNSKLLPLIFFAETARAFGANKITLIAPYLAYMRQDKQFHSNEGVTSQYFAKLISTYFDKLVTVDPHLHRLHSLNEIYTIPTKVLHSTQGIAHWISQHVSEPILIGPDAESIQWVSEIATIAKAPFVILKKIRKGDRDVEISMPNLAQYQNCTPVLVDDIISTGKSMIATMKHLQSLKMKPAVCIGVHGVFADNSYEDLLASGAKKIVTCNTILHPSNEIKFF